VHDSTISAVKTAIQFNMDAGKDASNIQIYNNTISDMDWGINVGGGDAGDTAAGILVHDNDITNWTNWQFPSSAMHQDGVILFNYAGGTQTLAATLYNNYIHGDLGVSSPTGFIYCAQNTSCTIFNNVLVNTGHVIFGIMWLDTHLGGYKVYNNTVVGNNSNDFGITFGTSAATNVNAAAVIENNIFTGVGVGIHDYSTLTADVSMSNRNVWRTLGGGAPQMATNDGTYVSYASWQGNGFDANSSTGNPSLDSSYHPQSGSSAIGLGANLTSLNIPELNWDKAGIARPATGVWDAGAYQH
jgi:hypothetical protein